MSEVRARARRQDPATSHEAAQTVEADGTAATQRQACVEEVMSHEGRTSMEIARDSGMDRYVVARRLGEMRNSDSPQVYAPEHRARVCAVSGRKALTWWRPPVTDGPKYAQRTLLMLMLIPWVLMGCPLDDDDSHKCVHHWKQLQEQLTDIKTLPNKE